MLDAGDFDVSKIIFLHASAYGKTMRLRPKIATVSHLPSICDAFVAKNGVDLSNVIRKAIPL